MNQLQVRCPSCAKLYQVDPSSIFSTSPHFQCVACPTTFTFEFPPPDPSSVLTRAVELPKHEAFVPMRECPKCKAESPKASTECLACGVIFSKVDPLTVDPAFGASATLVRQWKNLLDDYGNEGLHQNFLMACRDANALDFARNQYEAIRSAQGSDALADRMLERVGTLRSVAGDLAMAVVAGTTDAAVRQREERAGTLAADAAGVDGVASPASSAKTADPVANAKLARRPKKVEVPGAANTKSAPPRAGWMTAVLLSPFLVSLLLILWGYTHSGQRNMIGAGIACALLSAGLMVVFSGRLTSRKGT